MALVSPFLKPGKGPTLPSSYRPIALTSCLCKLMEIMVNTRLVSFLERTGVLSSSQCGFCYMHSCIDILILMKNLICKAFVSKRQAASYYCLFFYLEKAYDTAWRYGILKVLHDIGLRGEMPLFIKAFIKTRYFKVRVSNTLSDSKI